MSTNDIRTTLDRAKAWIEKSADPAEERGKLAKLLLPKHDPHTARIRCTEWLNGIRTPRSFDVCLKIAAWWEARKTVKKATKTKKNK